MKTVTFSTVTLLLSAVFVGAGLGSHSEAFAGVFRYTGLILFLATPVFDHMASMR